MPRRSKGCELCRKRKVRCDEGRPVCRKCADYGVACPGYRPTADKDIRFVDQQVVTDHKTGSGIVVSRVQGETNAQRMKLKWKAPFSTTGVVLPQEMYHAHTHRAALLGSFLESYFPKSSTGMTSHFSYLARITETDISAPLIHNAIDALCLAEIGSLYDDRRIIGEAQARYTRALPMLSREVARQGSHQIPKDHVLAAVTLLAFCELFDVIAKDAFGGHGWVSHITGAQQLIRTHGAEILKTELGRQVFHSIRYSSLNLGLVKRRAVFFAEPEWLKLTAKDAEENPFIALYDLCLRVPGILEMSDSLSYSENFASDFSSLCTAICNLRGELEHWHSHWIQGHYEIVDVREMKDFSTICHDRFFQTVFRFPYLQMCSRLQLYWVCMLILDFTFLYLNGLPGDGDLPEMSCFTTRSKEDIERDLYVTATDYCRSIPYCYDPGVKSAGRLGTFFLRVIRSYFEQSHHESELRWVQNLQGGLEKASSGPDLLRQGGAEKEASERAFASQAKHKPPISVRCCAPAPLLVDGEYSMYSGYKPREQALADLGGIHMTPMIDIPETLQSNETPNIPRSPPLFTGPTICRNSPLGSNLSMGFKMGMALRDGRRHVLTFLDPSEDREVSTRPHASVTIQAT